MSKGYKDGVGRHQRVFNMMRKKVPDIGYTGVCWVDAFTCMYRLYLDFIEHDQAGIGDGWEREIREYIRPVFPAFDLNAYIFMVRLILLNARWMSCSISSAPCRRTISKYDCRLSGRMPARSSSP